MPTFKISQLPAVTSIAGTEELEVNQSGTSRKATRTQIVAGLVSVGAVVSSGLTMNTARLLGRSTESAGAIEEITLGENIFLNNGILSASGGGGLTGVTSFAGGTTGLTPAVSAAGAITLGGVLNVASGGTSATTASEARTNLGAAASGANSDITSLAGLTTPLSVAQGGTGGGTAVSARSSLGLAIGANVQAYSAQLDSVAAVSVNGLIAHTAANTVTPRTLTAGTGIAVTNGSGVAGNPIIANTGVTSFSTGTTGLSPATSATGSVTLSGTLAVANGGTGATSAANARTSLGVPGLGANTFSGAQTATGLGITGGLTINQAAITFATGLDSIYYFNNNVEIAVGGTARFTVATSVATFLVPATGPSFTPTSDRALKINITPVAGALERVLAYNPVTFEWAPDVAWADGRVHQGFVAQDVGEVNPVAVATANNMAALDPLAIIADLVGAVQTLEARIANLSKE